ncbi:MAG: hypothetical protein EB027_02585 [Actinobacteria bacterium]|nr:hypothetical protein [Actinomycetota bacterium]
MLAFWKRRIQARAVPLGASLLTAVGCVCALVVPTAAGFAQSPTPKPSPSKTSGKYKAAIAAASDDLLVVNSKVRKASTQLKAAQAQLPAARHAYNKAFGEYRSSVLADRRARAELADATNRARRSTAALAKTDAALHASQDKFSTLVRQIYMSGGGMLQAQVVLESQNPVDLGTRIAGIDRVGRMSDRKLDRLRAVKLFRARTAAQARSDRAKEQQQRAAVARQVAVTKTTALRAAAAKAKVDALVAKARNAVAVVEREQQALKQRLAKLRALEKGIDITSKKNAGGVRPGSLAWPVIGHTRISSKAGPRNHPVFGRVACHAGIDIPAGSGTPIRAAASGIVLQASSVTGYGNMTLISHGGGMATLYGHQKRFKVRAGQHVTKNQIIGYVGSTGWSTGPHLHFEVRLAGKPYNPLGWFGGKRAPVSCYHK